MTKTAWMLLTGVVVLALVSTAQAGEYPLKVVQMTPDEAMNCPGSNYVFGQLQTKKPEALKEEPKAESKNPMYGVFRKPDATETAFRLDEAQGTGKGYDSLLIDLNRDGKLTDEKAFPVAKATENTAQMESRMLGPAEHSQAKGGWRPCMVAQVQVYNKSQIGQGGTDLYFGYVLLKAANYLEADIEVEGRKEKIALIDSNCDFDLAVNSMKGEAFDSGEYWFAQRDDAVMRDRNGSGKFERDMAVTEAEPLSRFIYFGAKPYRMAVAMEGDTSKLQIEACTGSLGELTVGTDSGVGHAVVGYEAATDRWEPIAVAFENGKCQAPAGRYRLYGCTAEGKGADGSAYRVVGQVRAKTTPTQLAANASAPLACGAPLRADCTVQMSNAPEQRSFRSGRSTGSRTAGIQLTLVGQGGEVYSTYVKAKGENETMPDQPRFKVTSAEGRVVAAGNVEYG